MGVVLPQAVTASLPVSVSVDFGRVAEETAGAVAADMHALLHAAVLEAMRRSQRQQQQQQQQQEMEQDRVSPSASLAAATAAAVAAAGFSGVCIEEEDVAMALRSLQLTLEKEKGHLPRGSLTADWGDIGGLKKAKKEIEEKIILPVLFPQLYAQIGEHQLRSTVYGLGFRV